MATPAPPVALHSREGRGVLLATALGSGLAFLDGTVVNVALASLGESMHVGMAGLQWVVDGYLLTLSSLLLIGGSLGDRYGRRKLFLLGAGSFAVTSALCGLSPSLPVLVAARALQGVAAALLVPTSLALVRERFRAEDQGAAIGAWAGLSGVTTALGPLLGGWLIGVGSWRAIFFINLPLAVIAAWAAWRCIPASGGSATGRIDLLGAVLVALGLAGATDALIEGPAHGWSPRVILSGVAGAALLAAFLIVEARRRDPMVPLGLFRIRAFSAANGVTLVVYAALSVVMFLLLLAFQRARGSSALAAGASLTPLTLLLLLLSPSTGRLAQRAGPRLPMTLGPLTAAAGLELIAWGLPHPGYLAILPGIVVFGLGLSLTVAPLTDAALAFVPAAQAGVASAINNAVARLAGLLGVALLPGLVGLARPDAAAGSALLSGVVRALGLSALLCAAGGVVAFLGLPKSQRHRRDAMKNQLGSGSGSAARTAT